MNHHIKDDLHVQLSPHDAVVEVAKVFWHLRSILAIMVVLFFALSIAMYYGGGAVNMATHIHSSFGETLYFCAVTALTIGYGDVVPTTTSGRIIAVLLGLLGVLMTGVTTGSTVYGIQIAAQRAGLRPR
jgi:voltage-gated potassium channel